MYKRDENKRKMNRILRKVLECKKKMVENFVETVENPVN